MPSQYRRLAQDLDTLFKPRLSTTVARAAVGYNTLINGVATDLALLYEPSRVTADRIAETTGIRIANGTDLKDLFMSLNTPIVPTFAISPNRLAINETDTRSVTFTIATTDLANGTALTAALSLGTQDVTLSSSNIVIQNSQATVVATAVVNSTAEVVKYFTVKLFYEGKLVAESVAISISDSANLLPTYTIVSNINAVNEGQAVVFTLSTTNIAENTELFWSANRSDLSPVTGSFIVGARNSVSITAVADFLTEGATVFNIELRSGSPTGPTLATSNSVTINDTSLTVLYPDSLVFKLTQFSGDCWSLRISGSTNVNYRLECNIGPSYPRDFVFNPSVNPTLEKVRGINLGGAGVRFNIFRIHRLDAITSNVVKTWDIQKSFYTGSDINSATYRLLVITNLPDSAAPNSTYSLTSNTLKINNATAIFNIDLDK